MNEFMWLPDLIKDGKIILINNGGMDLSKHDYSGWTVEAKNSAFALGEKATNANNYTIYEQNSSVSEELLNLIATAQMSEQQKQEMNEIIEVTAVEVATENPKKPVLKGLMNSATNIMDTITKSPELITAFEKWTTYIGNFM